MPDPDLSHLALTGTKISVRVTPRAAQNQLTIKDGSLIARVTAIPENGKANTAVQMLLSRSLGLAKSRLTLIRGATARNKVFRVD